MRPRLFPLVAWSLLLASTGTATEPRTFDGEWRTSFGIVNLEQVDSDVTGTYGNSGQFTLKGSVEGDKLTFTYQEGQTSGNAEWTLDESGHLFSGTFQIRAGRAGQWTGWRPDPGHPTTNAAT